MIMEDINNEMMQNVNFNMWFANRTVNKNITMKTKRTKTSGGSTEKTSV